MESHRAVSHAVSFRVADVPGETPYRSLTGLLLSHLLLLRAAGNSAWGPLLDQSLSDVTIGGAQSLYADGAGQQGVGAVGATSWAEEKKTPKDKGRWSHDQDIRYVDTARARTGTDRYVTSSLTI